MEEYVEKVIPMYMGRVGFKHNKKYLKVYSYLIYTKNGIYLYDTGLNELFIKDKEQILRDLSMFMLVEAEENKLLSAKLKQYGISPEDIKTVICSHLHFDHCGGLVCFKEMNIPIIVQYEEYYAAIATERSFEYKKEDYAEVKKNMIFIHGNENVDGNKNIQIVYTPGHSAGHQSLFITGRNKKILLTGDVSYTKDDFDMKKIMPFSYDKEKAEKSLHLLCNMAADSDYVICGHDCEKYSDSEITL